MEQISLNFGVIKDTIYRFASKEFITEGAGKKTILESFIKKIKENPALKIQYLIFENLEKGNFKKERLSERYIAQNLKLLENIDWQKIISINREVRISLLENCHVNGNAGKEKLYENIHTLIESATRPGYSAIDKSEAAFEAILEHLLTDKAKHAEKIEESDGPKILSWDFVTKLAVNNFNKRYAHLNESEQALLKVLLSSEDKKTNYLQDIKNENLKLIDELLNEEVSETTKGALNQFKAKLAGINTETIDETIINYSELKDSLLELKK